MYRHMQMGQGPNVGKCCQRCTQRHSLDFTVAASGDLAAHACRAGDKAAREPSLEALTDPNAVLQLHSVSHCPLRAWRILLHLCCTAGWRQACVQASDIEVALHMSKYNMQTPDQALQGGMLK